MTRPQPPSRDQFPYSRAIPTRWMDNDNYGHVNNVEYYSYFDTVINAWLIEEAGMDIHRDETIAVCAESGCRFLASASFPEAIEAGLRVGHLGNSSVRYEIGLFRGGTEAEILAHGFFVHVFVDRESRRPVPIPEALRGGLAGLAS